MWKAFITLFIIGGWGMLFMWALLIGAWFSPVPNSVAVVWKMILGALLNVLPAWALWALSVSVWTERQNLAIKVGLTIGTLFSAFLSSMPLKRQLITEIQLQPLFTGN